MTNPRGRTICSFAAGYVFLFTILPSARTVPSFVASSTLLCVSIYFIRRFDEAQARYAALWTLVLSAGIAWAFDPELPQRFDAFTGVLAMIAWGACALAAASPEVLVESTRVGARRLRGAALPAAGLLALLVHAGAWLSRGTQETRLLAHALSTAAGLCLAIVLAAPTRARRLAAAAGALMAIAGLFVAL